MIRVIYITFLKSFTTRCVLNCPSLYCNNSIASNTPIMETNHNKGNKTFKITGNWKLQSKQLKEKFSQLTDFDLKFNEGKETELLDKMGNRLRKNREEVMEIIKEINLS